MPASKEPVSLGPNPTHPALPPSVEAAYRQKCIDLKRRMNEVEESNDDYRRRKVRLLRGIRKMRLERAFLLETLAKRMKKSGSAHGGFNFPYDEDSDTTDGPPTPQEKPLRSKRGHRRVPQDQMSTVPSSHTADPLVPPPPGASHYHRNRNGPTPIAPHPTPSTSTQNRAHVTRQPQQQPQSQQQYPHPDLPPVHHANRPPSPNRDPNAPPEQPYSAYIDFYHQLADDVSTNRASHPSLGSLEELREYVQGKWAELPDEERRIWEDSYLTRVEAWRERVREWEKERGIVKSDVGEGEVGEGDADRMEGVEGGDEPGRGNGERESGFTAVNG